MDKQVLANRIANQLHQDWRKTRLNENGTYEPRWKKVKDQNFIDKLDFNNLPNNVRVNEGVVELDIANTMYENLSADWQAENKAAAEVVADILDRESKGEDFSASQIGSIIHNKWLERNEWAKGGELDIPFDKLPQNEKDKDLDQYRIGLSELSAQVQQEPEMPKEVKSMRKYEDILERKNEFEILKNLNDKQIEEKLDKLFISCKGRYDAYSDPRLGFTKDEVIEPVYNSEEIELIGIRFGQNSSYYNVAMQCAIEEIPEMPKIEKVQTKENSFNK